MIIKCILGKAYTVTQELAENVDEISEINSISGKYDLLAKFCVSTAADIGRFARERIQTLDRVVDTFTMITFKVVKYTLWLSDRSCVRWTEFS